MASSGCFGVGGSRKDRFRGPDRNSEIIIVLSSPVPYSIFVDRLQIVRPYYLSLLLGRMDESVRTEPDAIHTFRGVSIFDGRVEFVTYIISNCS